VASHTLKSVLPVPTGELAYPRSVAEFSDYRSAQDAVDRLVQAGVPPHEIAIVGRNVRSVERVLARTKLGAAARFGAVFGGWCGLAFGLPFLLAADPRGLTLAVMTTVFGALVGALWATIAHGLLSRGGSRRFAAAPVQLAADLYEVQVEHRSAEQARTALAQWPSRPPALAATG
jgi:hypothetical protein